MLTVTKLLETTFAELHGRQLADRRAMAELNLARDVQNLVATWTEIDAVDEQVRASGGTVPRHITARTAQRLLSILISDVTGASDGDAD
jgi:hypothetical protein